MQQLIAFRHVETVMKNLYRGLVVSVECSGLSIS